MKVNVRGKNKYVVTEDVKRRAEVKLQKMDQYFRNPDELQAEVVCKAYESYEVVEVTIPTKNIILRAEVKAESVLSAIDLAIDKLETQIRRHKDKIESHIKRRGGVKEHYAQELELDVEKIDPIDNFKKLVKEKQIKLEPMDKEEAIAKGLYNVLDDTIDEKYFEVVRALSIHPEVIKEMAKDIKIVYTPLHGTGLLPVTRVLKDLGFEQVYVVEEQATPDGNFPTCPSPNPENEKAYQEWYLRKYGHTDKESTYD